MRLLAFDTAGPAISAAAGRNGALLATRLEPLGRWHAERLLPMLREVLAEVAWDWRDIDLVVATQGPGNFTGLRAGIAVARGLALACQCRVLGIGTLELLAEAGAARVPGNERPLQAVLDARRGEVYAQLFTADLTPLSEPTVAPAAAPLIEASTQCLLVGDAAAVRAIGRECDDGVIEVGLDARYLLDAAWRRLAGGAAAWSDGVPRPLYVRQPDARLGAGASMLPARH